MKQIESFFLGIIAVLGALVIEVIIVAVFSFSPSPWPPTQSVNFFQAPQAANNPHKILLILFLLALVEEIFKYFVIAKKVSTCSVGRTMLLNSIIVGCGFATIELFFIFKNINLGLVSVASLRNFIEIFIIHATTAGVIGYSLAIANKITPRIFLKSIILATVIHFSYNALLLYDNYYINPLISLGLILLVFTNIANFLRINRRLAI